MGLSVGLVLGVGWDVRVVGCGVWGCEVCGVGVGYRVSKLSTVSGYVACRYMYVNWIDVDVGQ